MQQALEALVNERRDLREEEASRVMREIMSGQATSAQIGAFLTALRLKGETVEEITGMARVMRENALRVEVEGLVVDTCGTGGDAQDTFNVSTGAAFVAAGAGARIAKHGNRAMSSSCGSADILEALGARIDLGPEDVAACIIEVGIGFMFAQVFHPAMKHVAGPRRELGVRTVFNILGPLTNPAGAQAQVLGVANTNAGAKLASVLRRLGTRRALVVHGEDGVDELSLSGPSTVWDVRNGSITQMALCPEDVGLTRSPLATIRGGTPQENAAALRRVLGGERGPLRDVIVLNAAAALVAADIAGTFQSGVHLAEKAIDSGAALKGLDEFVRFTRTLGERRE